MIPITTVINAIDRRLSGGARYLAAAAVESSGRTGRVTCSYGVPDADGEPVVEVSLITYVDASAAGDRIELTVASAHAEGDTVTPQDVAGRPGYVLQGADGASLVLADGPRTVVVTVRPDVVAAAAPGSALEQIATAVLAPSDMR